MFKIVSDKWEPIGDRYSKEMSTLIEMLLEKDPNKRPSVREILKMPLIREKAMQFQQQTGL